MDYGLYVTKTINQPLNKSCPDFTGVLHISVIANTQSPRIKGHQSLEGSSHQFCTLWINMLFSSLPSHQKDMSAGWHIAGSEADKQELCLKHILLLFYIKSLQVRNKST